MLSIAVGKFTRLDGQNINAEAIDMIQNFFDAEYSTYSLFRGLGVSIGKALLSDERYTNDDENFFRNITLEILGYLGANQNDDFCSSIKDDYGIVYTTAFNYVKLFNLTEMNKHTRMIKGYIEDIQNESSIIEGYSWNTAFDILDKEGSLKDRILNFTKTLLLTNECFNADKIYRLRKMILKSQYLDEKDRNLFSKQKPNKDILKMFFADYRLLCALVFNTKDFTQYKFEDDNPEPLVTYILLFLYGRFILDVFILLFQCKGISAVKNVDIENENRLENNPLRMEIIFSKIYTRLEFKLYSLASDYMTNYENMKYILGKICDDICVHEQASVGYDILNRYSSFKTAITRVIDSNEHNDIIEEMKDSIIHDWDNGCKSSHVQMIEFLKKKKKYADALETRGVQSNLKKLLVNICMTTFKSDGSRLYPYIQGVDIWGKIERVSAPSNNTSENSEESKSGGRKKTKK